MVYIGLLLVCFSEKFASRYVLAIFSELTIQFASSASQRETKPDTNRKKDNIDKIHANNVAKPTKFGNFHRK